MALRGMFEAAPRRTLRTSQDSLPVITKTIPERPIVTKASCPMPRMNPRHPKENGVVGQVIVGVVDLTKMVKVDHQKRERLFIPHRLLQGPENDS